MDQSFAFAIGAALWAGVCAAALARGGWPERLAAATTLIGSIATPLVQARLNNVADPGVWAIDVVCTAIYLFIALKSDRWWALFAVAFRLAALISHAVQATFAPLPLKMYATTEILWAYLALAALFAGVVEVELRRRKSGLNRGLALPT